MSIKYYSFSTKATQKIRIPTTALAATVEGNGVYLAGRRVIDIFGGRHAVYRFTSGNL